MSFQPEILNPTPDPDFVRQLRKIDPDLRVVWGFQRYMKRCWVIERKIPPERYFAMYASLLESDAPRFIDQPIFDTDQPEYNDEGEAIGFRKIGVRRYDLAPEYEWVMNVVNPDDTRRELDARTLTELKRAYAWDRFHSLTRLKVEGDRAREEAEAKRRKQRADVALDGVKEGWRATGKILFGGQAERIADGTELQGFN